MRGRTERKQPVRRREQDELIAVERPHRTVSESVGRILKALGGRNGERTEQSKP
jgi:hypothetical protein